MNVKYESCQRNSPSGQFKLRFQSTATNIIERNLPDLALSLAKVCQAYADGFRCARSGLFSSLFRDQANTRWVYGYDFGLLARTFSDVEAQEITVEHIRAYLNMSAD